MSGSTEKGNTVEELIGFAEVARFIADDKEHTSSIYRRYERLAARDLLYLQEELRTLELQLEEFDREDVQGGEDEIEAAVNWAVLQKGARTSNSKESHRQKVIRKLRIKIKEYRKLLQLSRI